MVISKFRRNISFVVMASLREPIGNENFSSSHNSWVSKEPWCCYSQAGSMLLRLWVS